MIDFVILVLWLVMGIITWMIIKDAIRKEIKKQMENEDAK